MEDQKKSSALSGTIWGVIIVIGVLGVLALGAMVLSMFGMDVPGFSS